MRATRSRSSKACCARPATRSRHCAKRPSLSACAALRSRPVQSGARAWRRAWCWRSPPGSLSGFVLLDHTVVQLFATTAFYGIFSLYPRHHQGGSLGPTARSAGLQSTATSPSCRYPADRPAGLSHRRARARPRGSIDQLGATPNQTWSSLSAHRLRTTTRGDFGRHALRRTSTDP